MPLVCVVFAVWCGKSNKIKAFQKERANLFILYIGSYPSGGGKKKLPGKKVQTKELKIRFHTA